MGASPSAHGGNDFVTDNGYWEREATMPSAHRMGLTESGCMTGHAPGYGARRNSPKYLNLVPWRGLWGWTRGQGKGQRMGRGGQRMGKGRGTGRGRHRGKDTIPSSIAAPLPQIDGKEMSSSTTLPLPASPSGKDQQLEALKAQARATEQELRTLGEKISQMHGHGRRNSPVATVDTARCTGCGACATVCPMEAITVNAVAHVEAANCAGCGVCVDACPQEAITLKRVRKDLIR